MLSRDVAADFQTGFSESSASTPMRRALDDREQGGNAVPTGEGIAISEKPGDLAAINKPGMELVIWRRAFPFCFTTWLERMDASHLPHVRLLVEPGDFRRAIAPHLDECGMPDDAMRELLIEDIDDLVSAFGRITGSDLVDVRLEHVSHDACWKFHRDSVEARLLTTYRGPGTEWVQQHHAERALREQDQFKGPVEHFRENDVAIFKGSCAGQGSGVVHRSPPIAGTGQTRLLLCLNRLSVTSPEPWRQP